MILDKLRAEVGWAGELGGAGEGEGSGRGTRLRAESSPGSRRRHWPSKRSRARFM